MDEALPKPYYEEEGIVIYHGDCRDILPHLPKVDLVLTDPPYGIERFKKGFGYTRFKGYGAEKDGIKWDVAPDRDCLAAILNAAQFSIVWGSNNYEMPASQYFLVWDKMQTVDNFASAELAYTNVKIPAKVFRFSIHDHNQTDKFHPTQKPVELMKWCMGFVPEAKTILDPFAGSCTTAVAAKELGRKCICIEREEEYCIAAIDRLRQEVLPL
jgi:DNA modification methylase